MWTTIPLLPQVVRDESELAAKPFYVDALNMRSINGKMETEYGKELVNSTALTGVCRGAISWADLGRNRWAAFGTHLRVQVMDSDGQFSDITPVIERGELSSAFTTSSGRTLITVSDDNHGLVVDQKVNFPGESSAANVLISGAYVVSTVPSSSAYGFEASSTANASSAGAGPSVIDYEYFLKPGNESSLGGLGYGTGGYGSGGYGSPSTSQELDARTHTFAQWGQNLIVNPTWGGVYEWAPNVTTSELVANGDFASSASWTSGSGWAVQGGSASASAARDLSQTITLVRSSWHLLDFDVSTVSAGSVAAVIGTSTVGGTISTRGTYKRTFFSPVATSQSLVFRGGGTFSGQIDNVSVKVLTSANLLPGSPSSVGTIFVTAERNLVACGSTNPSTSTLDPMRVAWSAAENNQDWTASASNVAGSYVLSHGSRIVRGLAINRENLIWTDTALYRMRSVPDPSVVYAFDLLGEGCGLIGPLAVVTVDGAAFWITPQQKFMGYGGGAVTPLTNPSERDFRDNLADVQGAKINAARLSAKTEVRFVYPDERDGVECSREHVYNYSDQTWVSGLKNTTTMIDAGVYPYPISVDADSFVSFREKDFSNDGSARTTMLETAYFNVGEGEGDGFASIMGVRPDFDDLRGGGQITFTSRNYPQDPNPRTYGPYAFTGATKQLSVRIKGRQIKYKIVTNDAPSFYRVGAMTFDIRASGQRK